MDIIKQRQDLRKDRIEQIETALKIYVEVLGKRNLNFTYDSIIMATISQFYCTKRYAKEYIDLALYKVELTKEDLIPSWEKNKGVRFELIKNKNQLKRGVLSNEE
jgi:hypothetical protein